MFSLWAIWFFIFHFTLFRVKSFWLTKKAAQWTWTCSDRERWSWWWWNQLLLRFAVAMNCDAAQKYYYILIVVAVISWMDENNFLDIIENNLNALFTFIHVLMFFASHRSDILFAHVQELWLRRKFLLWLFFCRWREVIESFCVCGQLKFLWREKVFWHWGNYDEILLQLKKIKKSLLTFDGLLKLMLQKVQQNKIIQNIFEKQSWLCPELPFELMSTWSFEFSLWPEISKVFYIFRHSWALTRKASGNHTKNFEYWKLNFLSPWEQLGYIFQLDEFSINLMAFCSSANFWHFNYLRFSKKKSFELKLNVCRKINLV